MAHSWLSQGSEKRLAWNHPAGDRNRGVEGVENGWASVQHGLLASNPACSSSSRGSAGDRAGRWDWGKVWSQAGIARNQLRKR